MVGKSCSWCRRRFYGDESAPSFCERCRSNFDKLRNLYGTSDLELIEKVLIEKENTK